MSHAITKRLVAMVLTVSILYIPLLPCADAVENILSQQNDMAMRDGQVPSFVVGPYLLAPGTNSMTVVWECDQSLEKTSISYRKADEPDDSTQTVAVSPTANIPPYNGVAVNLYQTTLTDLQPDTKYQYTVILGSGESITATFKTLPETLNSDSVNFMAISDSHSFGTKEAFNTAVFKQNPDFILQLGDIIEGTGTQKDQFEFWLNSGDFIHYYPIVYACGNHDYGTYYDWYITYPQKLAFGETIDGNISFDYGEDMHFALMDSNPWGLLQMNTETSGGTLDSATAAKIEASKEWLAKDLEANQDKTFRILGMHHPKSMEYTQKQQIPEIAEKYHVNLMLGGHTHTYALDVSDDPSVGANTTYITLDDANMAGENGDYMVFAMQDDVLICKNMYTAVEDPVNIIPISSGGQKLSYSNISISPNQLYYYDEVTVSATVENIGDGIAAAVLPVYCNDSLEYIYDFAQESENDSKILFPGESKTYTGKIRMTELGQQTLKLANVHQVVDVAFRDATFRYSNIRTKLGDSEVSDINSNKLHIKADIMNIGNAAGQVTIPLTIDGQVVDQQKHTIPSGDTHTVEFVYTFDDYGDHTVKVGDADEKNIYIEGTIQGMPIALDKSGNENHGYIHGEPELGKDDKDNTTLILDGKRDYIEIPDSETLRSQDGLSGIVKAKLLDKPKYDMSFGGTLDHNPLLWKGVSLGWGNNYFYRMVVRANGRIAYGSCFKDDNGEFYWDGSINGKNSLGEEGAAQRHEWTQFASTFDRKNGGHSYQNNTSNIGETGKPFVSGQTEAPAVASYAEMMNWPGSSAYIGFAYYYPRLAGRNRGMYNTFLNAEISQARMYDVKLSEDEIYYLYQNPSEEGDSFAEHAMFFLDFNDIVTEGTHTTEWVPTQGALSQLDYCAQIEGNASIKAKVQLSDDKKTLLEEQTFVLQNGTNIIDLSGMNENAAYVRIVTEFVSDLNEVESHIPVLEKYDLKMTTGNKIWSTTAAWAQGTFAYAAGHQSADVYEWHRTDFDDFSGEVSAPDAPIESSSGGSGSSYSDHAISISTITNGSVNVSPKNAAKGETVTITVSPDAGYELDALTVTDKDGKAIRLTDKGNGKYTFTMTDGKVTVKATFAKTESKPEPVSSFTDVNADDWFAEAVQYVLDQGMMNGTSATSFSPDATTTRGMIVTILHRLEGEPTAAASDFSDVAAGTWYADAVAWAAENGVVNGVSKTSFAPNAPITREQLAAILFRYAQFKGYDVSVGEDTNILSYTDAGQISEYAIPAMQWACGAGVITGMGDGTLNPQGTATRAQVATMLMRFCESVEYDAAA